ncbi:MAG: hypothetical protein KBG48_06040 [Kofleriaceae bacterium]|nr:hypothetical protein [Kofleriaceae bacterium]MBP9166926.1 hypothetical protein [Kofleriaceae bacterium]MBP9863007.1 hypothetical protein [Kofleriaceae bacterium]
MDYGRRANSTTQPPPRAQRATGPVAAGPGSVLDGLWVLLIANEDQLPTADADGRVPMMAKSGDTAYLLGFKTVVKARQFLTSQGIEGAEPRMVVRGNRDDMVRIAQSANAQSVLIDYEPANQSYAGIQRI